MDKQKYNGGESRVKLIDILDILEYKVASHEDTDYEYELYTYFKWNEKTWDKDKKYICRLMNWYWRHVQKEGPDY